MKRKKRVVDIMEKEESHRQDKEGRKSGRKKKGEESRVKKVQKREKYKEGEWRFISCVLGNDVSFVFDNREK